MGLVTLQLQHFRNIKQLTLDCHPRANVVVGPNGSGKTSILEAIFLLGRTRSFRTQKIAQLVQHEQEECIAFGRSTEVSDAGDRRIGWRYRKGDAEREIHVDGRKVGNVMEVINASITSFVGPDNRHLLIEGPAPRRQFMDWGVFHVEHDFLAIWRRFHRALRQRNALLKSPNTISGSSLEYWDQILVADGTRLAHLRQKYIDGLGSWFCLFARRLLGNYCVDLQYAQGWAQGTSLDAALAENLPRDRDRGFTGRGPHRGDFGVRIDGRPAPEFMSKGQQKLLVYSLHLAQLAHLRTHLPARQPILLVDDLPAELDREKRKLFFELIRELDVQLFVTATEAQLLTDDLPVDVALFHVEQGNLVRPTP